MSDSCPLCRVRCTGGDMAVMSVRETDEEPKCKT